MHKHDKVALIIPALNEERSIGEVIRSFLALRNHEGSPIIDLIVVGDNASVDRTAEIAKASGAIVVSEPRRGYGAACLAAIAVLPPDIGIIVFADADRSDEPTELPSLLDALDSGVDLVIGSRALGEAEPGALMPQQRFGNRLAAFLIRMIWKHPITDLGPFRAIRRSAYEKLSMADRTYGWTVEMQVKAIQSGLAVTEVPASYHRRVGISKISGTIRGTIGAGSKILGMIALLWYRGSTIRARSRPALSIIAVVLGALALWFANPSDVPAEVGPPASRPTHEAYTSPAPWTHPSMKGIALTLHEGDSYDYRPLVDEIASTGASAIELVLPYYQDSVTATNPGPKSGSTPSLEFIAAVIRRARERGMQVHLLPIVLLDHSGDDEWRGVMKPRYPERWWNNYGCIITDLARLAAQENVQSLSVGSELLWSEKMRNRWIPLINSVKEIYSGRLLYSANWDHYRPVAFWDKLDAIGISGYFELTRDSEATVEDLRSSWRSERDTILAWRREIGKPMIFTEVGYPAIDGGAVYPWNYTIAGRPDEEEQRRAFSAFFDAWRDVSEIEGAFVYEWGIPDRGGSVYSPRGRLVEKLVRDWMMSAKKEGEL